MNAIERLRAMLNEDDWRLVDDEDAAEWLHENGAAVEALYQAASSLISDVVTRDSAVTALAAAVRRIEGTP